jgi:ribosomal protein S27E
MAKIKYKCDDNGHEFIGNDFTIDCPKCGSTIQPMGGGSTSFSIGGIIEFIRKNKIVFGATVNLLDENDKPVRYQLVGETEADAKAGRISYNSPLGRALIGRVVEDEVELTVPSGDKYYLVSKIEFI